MRGPGRALRAVLRGVLYSGSGHAAPNRHRQLRSGGAGRTPALRAGSAVPAVSRCRSSRSPPSAPRSPGSCGRSAWSASATSSTGVRAATSRPPRRSRSPISSAARRSRSRARSPTCASGAPAGASRSSPAGSPTPPGRSPATWFNQPWLADQLRPGTRVRLRGRPGRRGFEVQLVRHRRGARDRRLRARVRRQRAGAARTGCASSSAPRSPSTPPTCSTRSRPSSISRSRATPSSHSTSRPTRPRPSSRGQRLAFDELVALQLAVAALTRRGLRSDGPAASGRARRALPRGRSRSR